MCNNNYKEKGGCVAGVCFIFTPPHNERPRGRRELHRNTLQRQWAHVWPSISSLNHFKKNKIKKYKPSLL